ncbi:thioredoxin family protein [Fredinandcohnia sp. 179-A 10B2 NHS]|uniref:thioredoxin family protein n=1 Tax=Fredinandcohnia sp. 179-A 10B2 NHS TaxID=3235176 RepID=UPI0039A1495D
MDKISSVERFNEVINSDGAIVVFDTTWCPDCRRLEMFIGDIISSHNNVSWHSIDKDEFPDIAEKYNVMGIPSLLYYKNGEKLGHLHSANAKTPDQVNEYLEGLGI